MAVEIKKRSIPACAGETLDQPRQVTPSMVYPRVCGGNEEEADYWNSVGGLSPRVRGKRALPDKVCMHSGSIPACAGETRRLRHCPRTGGVYPRVCGGNYWRQGNYPMKQGLSPRVRGKRWGISCSPSVEGSIPACAGETPPRPAPAAPERVYPRVCGGNCQPRRRNPVGGGLSPRVRGKLNGLQCPAQGLRSIPACAGET